MSVAPGEAAGGTSLGSTWEPGVEWWWVMCRAPPAGDDLCSGRSPSAHGRGQGALPALGGPWSRLLWS